MHCIAGLIVELIYDYVWTGKKYVLPEKRESIALKLREKLMNIQTAQTKDYQDWVHEITISSENNI